MLGLSFVPISREMCTKQVLQPKFKTKTNRKMKFIFSSFLVGLGTSMYVGYELSEQLRDRRLLVARAQQREHLEEEDALVYQKVS
jgi:uncharacterized membrane protein YczE